MQKMLKRVEHEITRFWMIALLGYKQFENGYFSKLFFVAVAFSQLRKIEWKKCKQTAENEWNGGFEQFGLIFRNNKIII